jgi:hypothetical protein
MRGLRTACQNSVAIRRIDVMTRSNSTARCLSLRPSRTCARKIARRREQSGGSSGSSTSAKAGCTTLGRLATRCHTVRLQAQKIVAGLDHGHAVGTWDVVHSNDTRWTTLVQCRPCASFRALSWTFAMSGSPPRVWDNLRTDNLLSRNECRG